MKLIVKYNTNIIFSKIFLFSSGAALSISVEDFNGSDNLLLNKFINPALGCSSWTTTELAAGTNSTSLAMDEIFAAFNQVAPIALVPQGDPFTVVNGVSTFAKVNAYRAGVFQPPTFNFTLDGSQKAYCFNLINTGAPRLKNNMNRFARFPSPDKNLNLYDFLKTRFMTATGADGLNCAALGFTAVKFKAADLAITNSNASTTAADATATQGMTSAEAGMIAGVTIAGFVVLSLLTSLFFCLWMRSRNSKKEFDYPHHNEMHLNSKNVPNQVIIQRSQMV